MPKLTERLQQIRDAVIWDLYQQEVTAEDIGIIFGRTTSQIYNIIKDMKGQKDE